MNGGIRWVALKEGRESVNGGRYDWAEAFGKDYYEKLGGEDCNLAIGYFSGLGVWFWRLGELL
jgi:hypothetical protein